MRIPKVAGKRLVGRQFHFKNIDQGFVFTQIIDDGISVEYCSLQRAGRNAPCRGTTYNSIWEDLRKKIEFNEERK